MATALSMSALQVALQVVRQRLSTLASRLSERTLTVGLDIGSTSIKVVALGPRKGGTVRPVVGHNLVPLGAGQGLDAAAAIKSAVDSLPLSDRRVNLSVSGQQVVMRVVEMPSMKPAELRQALPFEAQRYIPFNIQDVVVDGTPLGPAEGKRLWVLIVACKKELLERQIGWIKGAGLEPAIIDVDALALANAFLASRGDGGRCALVDVGFHLTNLVVFTGRVPYLVRDIPWGSHKLIRSMADQLGGEAEHLAKDLTTGQISPDQKGAMALACEGLATELQLSFDFFENRFGQPPEAVLVSGGLSQSSAFLEALNSHLAQTVAPWSPTSELTGQFAVAYGLALRGD